MGRELLDKIDQVYLAAEQDKDYLQMQEEMGNSVKELCKLWNEMTEQQREAVNRYTMSVIRLHRYLVVLACSEEKHVG